MRPLIFRLSVGLLTFAFGLTVTSWFYRSYSQIATPPPVIIPDRWKRIGLTDSSSYAPVEAHIPIRAFSQSELVSTVKKKIGPQGPTFVFKLYSIPAFSNYHYRIDVCDGDERIVLQSESIRNGVRLEGKPKSFQIVDVNSDNYDDIKVLGGYSEGRAWYKVALYDPDRQEYVWVT